MMIELSHIHKQFHEHVIFDDFSLTIEEGSFTILHGASGCGKSTLLNMIGLLEKPDKGEINMFGEQNVKPFTRKAEKLLQTKIGYLFQNYALEDNESVETNMQIAMELLKIKKEEKVLRIKEALERVGLTGFEHKMVFECSGGEQQRIAIARLLVKPCDLILADEPTGNLDKDNKHMVFKLLKELQKEGKTLIVVTHDEEMKELGDRWIKL